LSRYARRLDLDVEGFTRDVAENTFLHQIEAEYQRALFDEHVTGTPTIYINEIRYTGATDLEGLLEAIKQADTEDRIRLPERHGLRSALGRLRRGANR